jgi:ribose transport system substrate-binding protein
VNVGLAKTIPLSIKNLRVAFVPAGLNLPDGPAEQAGVEAVASKYGIPVSTIDPQASLTHQFDIYQTIATSGKYNAIITLPMGGDQDCNVLSKTAPAQGIVVSVMTITICGREFGAATGDALWSPGTLNTIGVNSSLDAENYLFTTCATATGGGPAIVLNAVAGTPSNKSLTTAAERVKGIDIVANYATDYTAATAAQDTAAALSAHPNLKLVLSVSPPTTLGAIQAIRAAGKVPGKDVKLCSDTGGSAQMLSLVKSGVVAVDQYQNDRWIGMAAMQSIIDAIQGKNDPRVIGAGPDGAINASTASYPPAYTKATAGQYPPNGE